jgi:hypothetical protein
LGKYPQQLSVTKFREVTVNKFLLGTIATVMAITTSLIVAPPSHAFDCASGGPCAIGDIGPGGGIIF